MKERFEIFDKIAKRAKSMNLLHGRNGTLNLWMDLEHADEEFHLRLEELLNADDFNFVHDICGIQRHINRETGKMEDCFVPRFAGN